MTERKNSKPLSSMALKAMKPGDKVLVDTGENRGLRMSCGNAGTKTFFYRYKSPLSQKLTQVTIGRFPVVTLADARVKLQNLKNLKNGGRCPAAELQEEKQRLKEASVSSKFTVQQLIELYLRQYIEDRYINEKLVPGARKKKGQKETRRTLYGDAVAVLGDRLAKEITRKDVVSMVMDIVGRGANVQAGNVLRELSSAYEFAIGLGKFDDDFANPALLAKNSLRQAKVRLTSQSGKRALTEKELIAFLAWLPGSIFTPTQKNVLRFALWTACRTGEICNAHWKDVDLKAGTWHLTETKTGIERYVRLPRQAINFLEQLTLTTGDCLFPSQKTGKPIQQKSLTEQAWHLRSSKRMLDIPHWTPHDFRRTVRTSLSRMGCPNEVAEAMLGHSRSGIEGTYDLHKYEEEVGEWLQKWADYLESLSS